MPDAALMTSVAQTYFTKVVIEQHGSAASAPLRILLDFLRKLYENVAPEMLTNKLVVFGNLDGASTSIAGEPIYLSSLEGIADLLTTPCVIQCVSSSEIRVWRDKDISPGTIAQTAVVYSYEGEVELIYAKNEQILLEKIAPDAASRFAVPTFNSLHEALKSYEQAMIKSSSCPIFNEVWFDAKRIFLKNGPEHQMRNSLTHFLKVRLRGNFEVRPEQVVDSSHPVDIKVTWWMTNRLALIEIKWLGQSRDIDKLGTKHSDSRAREGAKQLADYLDANRTQAPLHQTRGYLVIVDARRAKLKKTTLSVSDADGMKYRFRNLSYNPEYHLTRQDFHEPLRMFAEPRIG
jgi:hypothetical protein